MYNLATLINNSGKVVATDKAKLEVLNNIFLQSSMATSLSTPLEWLYCKTGTGGVKVKGLEVKIRFMTPEEPEHT